MGALNTFALAGALVIGATAVASGADLPPPPMPAYPAAPLRGSIDSGVYLRGDVGMGAMGDAKARYQNLPATTNVTYRDGAFGNVGFAGAGVGYQFNSWLRADVTGELRGSSKFGFRDTYTDAFGNAGNNSVTGTLSTALFMANGYVDLGTWAGLTPFVGGGVGIARHKMSALDDVGNALPAAGGGPFAAVGGFDGRTKSSFAWQLSAGVAYDVTQNVKLELGYRYLNMGKADSGPSCALNCLPGLSVRMRDIQSHDVKLGFRWLLGGPDYGPAPTPMVIRKG